MWCEPVFAICQVVASLAQHLIVFAAPRTIVACVLLQLETHMHDAWVWAQANKLLLKGNNLQRRGDENVNKAEAMLEMIDGYIDGWLAGWMDGWLDGWLAGWMDR